MTRTSTKPIRARARVTRQKKRNRLTPAARKRLILDAALFEFGAHGFGGTSTGKIARRAGLSQSGLYAHYQSKEAILRALLGEVLTPKWEQWMRSDRPMDDAAIDRWIDLTYGLIAEPRILSMLRIVITEGARLPRLIAQWRRDVVKPYLVEFQRRADELAASGKMQKSALSEEVRLAFAPMLHALFLHLVFEGHDDTVRNDIAAIREAHRKMLKDLLAVKAAPASMKRNTAPRFNA
ncbi:MAG: TetR/AcrR family transcriptional regulator [Proteobacteria bacterium]|nr:TetR/AcrR family transcriptional regulator [Pseudomonadota bacterium]